MHILALSLFLFSLQRRHLFYSIQSLPFLTYLTVTSFTAQTPRNLSSNRNVIDCSTKNKQTNKHPTLPKLVTAIEALARMSPRTRSTSRINLFLSALALLAVSPSVLAIGDFPCAGSTDSQSCSAWSTDGEAQGEISADAVCQPGKFILSLFFASLLFVCCFSRAKNFRLISLFCSFDRPD